MVPRRGWLPLIVVWGLYSQASANIRGQYFHANSSLVDKDFAQHSSLLVMEEKSVSARTCARFCFMHGASCRAFSIQKPPFSSGTAACKLSNDARAALVNATDVVVHVLGLPARNMLEACVISEQCPARSDATCSDGICSCKLGFEISYDSQTCLRIPPVDSSGFQHYFDGYAYKRVPGGASSLSQARDICSSIGASLPVPYGVPGVGVKSLQALRTFARPGEESYIGLAASGSYSMRTFITENGTIVDANAKATDTSQFWAPGEPNAMSDTEAAAVTMTTSGWQDKPDNTTVNAVICSRWSGYTLNPISGKYYKLGLQQIAQTDSVLRACRAEGGQLAITYGAIGLQIIKYFLDMYKANYFCVDGTDASHEGLWVFSDGTALQSSQKVIDPLQHWVGAEPNAGPGEDCMFAYSYGWGDGTCFAESTPYALCERDF